MSNTTIPQGGGLPRTQQGSRILHANKATTKRDTNVTQARTFHSDHTSKTSEVTEPTVMHSTSTTMKTEAVRSKLAETANAGIKTQLDTALGHHDAFFTDLGITDRDPKNFNPDTFKHEDFLAFIKGNDDKHKTVAAHELFAPLKTLEISGGDPVKKTINEAMVKYLTAHGIAEPEARKLVGSTAIPDTEEKTQAELTSICKHFGLTDEQITKLGITVTASGGTTPKTELELLKEEVEKLKNKKLGILEYSGIAGLIAALGMSIASIASLGALKKQFGAMQQAMQANSVQIGQALTAVYNDSQQKIAALNEQISQLLNILNDAQDATMTLIKNITGRQTQVAQAMHSSKTTTKRTFNSSRTMNAGEQTATTAEPTGATNNANPERIAAAAKKQADINAAAKNAIPQSITLPAGTTGAAVPFNPSQSQQQQPQTPQSNIGYTVGQMPDGQSGNIKAWRINS